MHPRITTTLDAFAFLPDLHAVGGCVRDALFQRDPHDIDLATSATPDRVRDLASQAGLKAIPTGEQHGTMTLVHPELGPTEVTTFRRDISTDGRRATVAFATRIEEDLGRRDFTINAMALHPSRGLIDPFSGSLDLERRTLRFVGDPEQRIREDYLRVIRALRFANRYDLTLQPATRAALRQYAQHVPVRVSIERIVQEIDKAFQDPTASKFLLALYRLGILTDRRVLPELTGAHRIMQNPKHHPEGDVLSHVLQVVDRAPSTHRWHALLHDIGKPSTARIVGSSGYCSFWGHDKRGAEMIPAIAQRLRLSNSLRDSLVVTTRLHMQPLALTRHGHEPSPKQIRRLQARAGTYLNDLRIVCDADAGHRRGHINDLVFQHLEEPITPVLLGRHLQAQGYHHANKPTQVDELNFTKSLSKAFDHQLDHGVTDLHELLRVALSTRP